MFTSQHTLQNPFYMLGLEYNATLFDGNTRARVLAALKLKQQQIETDNDTADRELNDAANEKRRNKIILPKINKKA